MLFSKMTTISYVCLNERRITVVALLQLSKQVHYAICRKDQDIEHGNGISIWIKSAVICVLGLCIIPICIKKYFAGNALQFI